MVGEALAQLPRYQCHKQVRAVKIRAIVHGRESSDLLPFDTALPVVTVDPDWINKHEPQAGGYFVLYDDGYQSYSPAEAFEAGYTLMTTSAQRVSELMKQLQTELKKSE